MTHVAVVGGGLAGITAALDLAEAGVEVTLLESRGWLGGATFSVEHDGLLLDNGQHVFLRCCTAYRDLIRRLGVETGVTLQERLAIPVVRPGGRISWLRRNGLPAPFHLAASIARFGPLAATDRMKLGRAVLALRRLDLDDPSLDEETFGRWLAAHGQGERATEALWDLITLPTVNVRSAGASLALAAFVFKVGLLEDSAACDIGWANIPLQQLHGEAALATLGRAGVDVQLRVKVTDVLRHGHVAWQGGSFQGDAVILAVPHDAAAALLPEGALPEGLDPRRLGFSPIVNLHVAYDRRVLEHAFVAGVGTPVQFVFDRTESAGLAEGQLLAVSLSGADEYVDLTLDELRRIFIPAIADLLPRARQASATSFWATREPRATFRGVPGTAAHRPGAETASSGLFLAGAWTDTRWPATMEGAVRSGHAAASAVLGGARARREVAA